MSKLDVVVSRAVSIILLLIVGYLAVISLFSTCIIDAREITHYENSNIAAGMLYVLIPAVVLLMCRRFRVNINIDDERLMKIILTAFFIFGCYIVIATQMWPKMDQNSVMQLASELKSRHYSGWEPGGYAYMYPNQNGFILFLYMVFKVIGDYNNVGIQLLNVIMLTATYYIVYKMMPEKIRIKVLAALCMFYPMTLYVTFVYGTVPGLFMAVLAMYGVRQYVKNNRMVWLLLTAVCITAAILIKMNYLIFMIALIIVLLVNAITGRKWMPLAGCLMIVTCYMLGSRGLTYTIEHMTNGSAHNGVPMEAWIVMGLEEGNRASGWFSATNETTYIQSGYDTELTRLRSRDSLNEYIQDFSKEPDKALAFFSRKVASQWNNPDFECFWNMLGRDTDISMGKLTRWFITQDNKVFNIYLKAFHVMTLAGTLMFIISGFRRNSCMQLLPGIIFIGGFLFHLFWEAKCQYTIVYFLLLIPYAVAGYEWLAAFIWRRIDIKNNKTL